MENGWGHITPAQLTMGHGSVARWGLRRAPAKIRFGALLNKKNLAAERIFENCASHWA